MSPEKLHLRYAKAFYQLAQSQGAMADIVHDVQRLSEAHDHLPSFVQFLQTPLVKPTQKKDILTKALQSQLHPTTLTFLTFLITKRRESHLQGILQQYLALHRLAQHLHTAHLTTAQPLSAPLKASLLPHIQTLLRTQEPVQLIEKVDPSIIGGYILTVDGQQLDMSIRTQLQRLQQHWTQAPLPPTNTPNTPTAP